LVCEQRGLFFQLMVFHIQVSYTQNPFTSVQLTSLRWHIMLTLLTHFLAAQEKAPKSSPPYIIESKRFALMYMTIRV